MKRAELGDVARVNGRLAEVVAISEGRKVILQFAGAEPCPFCGRPDRFEALEHSPLFQDSVVPVETVGGQR